MIRYALACEIGHQFEAWFGASGDFDDQSASGLLSCPICASPRVGKQVMAPAVVGTRRGGDRRTRSVMMEAMGKLRAHVEDNFDYVGKRFAIEAREIHEGSAEVRGIYGEASAEEIKGLLRDGVPVAALPPAPPESSELN